MTHGVSTVTVVSLEDGGTTTVAGGDRVVGPAEPRWSPDGSRIAYIATPGTSAHYVLELWTVAPDGSDPLRLYRGECCTDGSAGPVWSPDGSRIAFNDGERWFVVPADGSGPAETSTPEVAARFS
jgi:Tol biopolymer transport system component